MAKLKIHIVPDPVLKRVADPVDVVTNDIRKLMDDMLETMSEDYGIAAPQVGISKRIIVIGFTDRGPLKKPLKIINPEVLWTSEETSTLDQGCLSVPGFSVVVERPNAVRISYMDEHGKNQVLEDEGFMAQCILHEIDHLNGITILDYLSPLKKTMAIKKLKKYKLYYDHQN